MILGIIILIIGQIIFWSACICGGINAEYKEGYDFKSRMADLGFWLSILGITIFVQDLK